MTDFARILRDALWTPHVAGPDAEMADRDTAVLLTTKVPELCQAQLSSGCPCPDCPTIGQLLAIGAAVLGPDFEGDGSYPHTDAFLDRLRAVQP